MPYRSSLEPIPTQRLDFLKINSPEERGSIDKGRAVLAKMMGLAEKVRHRKTHVEGRVSKVNHFVIQQNEFAVIEECVFRTVIPVNQAEFGAHRVLRQHPEKTGGRRKSLSRI